MVARRGKYGVQISMFNCLFINNGNFSVYLIILITACVAQLAITMVSASYRIMM